MDSSICRKYQNTRNFTNIELYELRLRLWIVVYVGNLKIKTHNFTNIELYELRLLLWIVAYAGNIRIVIISQISSYMKMRKSSILCIIT